MRGRSFFSRLLLAAVLGAASGTVTEVISPAGWARAAAVENLMVPSAAMGRDIPVTFMAGGPHAVYLLDAFDAGPEVSNWVTAAHAMNTLAGNGISVAAPAGGAYSMYTDWEQDGSKRWETFLSSELPNWLAANKGLAPGGHAVVGAAQGGYAAMALAAFHPDRFGYAGSMSGFLYPSSTNYNGPILAGLQQFGGVDGNAAAAAATRDLGDTWDIVTDMAVKLVPGGHPYHAFGEAAANAARAGDIAAVHRVRNGRF